MHLLVPAQWGGSVEHYYHFLLGYLFPVTLWLSDHSDSRPVVRDCGPMNPWFGVVGRDVTLIAPGTMLHRLVRGAPATVLTPSDDPESFDSLQLARFRAEILHRVGGAEANDSGSQITLLRRGRSHPYYDGAISEQRYSGAFRRSIPNLAEVADRLERSWPVALVDAADLAPAAQIRLHASTRVLIGQHGAGLANMIWMPPGSYVVEVLPPMPAHLSVIFRNLAAALGHRYTAIQQRSAHAPVNAADIANAVAERLHEPIHRPASVGGPGPISTAGTV